MFLPSKLLYQISSGSLCWMSLNNSWFTFVICRGFASIMKRSPMLVWVEIVAAIVDPSGVAVNAPTACGPFVNASTLPVAMVSRFRFALPCSAETTMTDAASFDQTILLLLCPRGGA
jgi:hypothetical protein